MASRKLTDDEFGAKLVALYRAFRDLHESGQLDSDAEHPRDTVNSWADAVRTSKANDEGGLGPVEIQNKAKPEAEDDVQPRKSANGNSGNGGATPAQDSAADDMIRRSGHSDIPGQLALAAARRVDPSRAANMASAIKGYGRLTRR